MRIMEELFNNGTVTWVALVVGLVIIEYVIVRAVLKNRGKWLS